jgi:hypothetical protein
MTGCVAYWGRWPQAEALRLILVVQFPCIWRADAHIAGLAGALRAGSAMNDRGTVTAGDQGKMRELPASARTLPVTGERVRWPRN